MAPILRRLLVASRTVCRSSGLAGLLNVNVGRDSASNYRTLKRNVVAKCTNAPPFITRLAMRPEYDMVMAFMHEHYFKYEPSLVNIGLANRAPPSIVRFMYEHVKKGMTMIAINPDNCIVGVAINGGSCPWHPERAIEFADCCEQGLTRQLIKFHAHVTMEPQLWQKYCIVKIFECCYLAVDSEYQRVGLGKRLVRDSWQLAKDCSYELFRIDCTSTYTARIAENFGWECVYELPYERYLDNGERVFKNVQKPHVKVQVYIDRLGYCEETDAKKRKRTKGSFSRKKKKKKKRKE